MGEQSVPTPVAGYEQLIEQSTAGIFELQDNKISFVNQRFATVFGYERDELVGTSPLSLLADHEHQAFKTDMEALAQGDIDTVQRVYTMKRKNGDEFVVRARVTQSDHESDSVHLGFVNDVSDRGDRESERQTIIDRVTDGVVEIDEDWNFTLVDDRAAEIYEINEDDLRGRYFWDIFPGARGTRFEEVYCEVMETRESDTIVEYNTDLNGWFHVEVYPKRTGGLAFYFQDISDRKRHQERISGLKENLSEWMKVDSRQEICNLITETAEERLHIPITAIALVDEQGVLRPIAQSKGAQNHLSSTDLFDEDDGCVWHTFTTGEPTQIDKPSSYVHNDTSIDELFVHPLGRHGVLVTGTPTPDADFIHTLAEDIRMTFDRINREEQLRNREELLEEQNSSLNRLSRINTVIRNIDQVLVNASTRTEIERAVCENLTGGDTYTFAWIGEYESTTDRIHPVEAAGYQQ